MSKDTSGNRGNSRRRAWRTAGCVLAISLIGVFAAQALAASPKPGCWGTCGGDSGPVGGYFNVSHGKVEMFALAEACLGYDRYHLENSVTVPTMKVMRAGKFAFVGKGDRIVVTNSGRTINHAVHVALNGVFATRTRAKISIMIVYDGCGTKHLTVKFAG